MTCCKLLVVNLNFAYYTFTYFLGLVGSNFVYNTLEEDQNNIFSLLFTMAYEEEFGIFLQLSCSSCVIRVCHID